MIQVYIYIIIMQKVWWKSRGNTKQTTMTTIQNPISIQRPTITKCREDQSSLDCRLARAFCNPANQGYTCPQSPAVETGREQACKYHRAGPRPARVVTPNIPEEKKTRCVIGINLDVVLRKECVFGLKLFSVSDNCLLLFVSVWALSPYTVTLNLNICPPWWV